MFYGEKDNERHVRKVLSGMAEAGIIEPSVDGAWRLKEAS